MEAVAAAAMVDLNTLSRRELQALCKLNGVRANMTNLAMVEALQSLPSVDGIDQIGTALCLPTPGKSAMKSALRTAAASDQQQQGSPLPRGRRVSVKSPEAIRMDAEEEDDETKRDLIREIVRTPGVALCSTSRRPRATPAPLPTPAAGTLRRSQRSTARKATAPVEEVQVSTAKRSTRKTARSMVMLDLDQEEEDSAAAAQAQQVEPKAATSDKKCHDPEEQELPEDGNSKADEPEQAQEGAAAIGEDEKLVEAEKSAPLSAMDGSPILSVLSNATPEPAMKNVENTSTEDREVFGNLSPLLELADEINSSCEDKDAVAVPEEAVKEDVVNSTVEDAVARSNMVSAAMTEKEVAVDESSEENDLAGESSKQADLTEQSIKVDDLDQEEEDMLKSNRTVDEESGETIVSAAAPNKTVPAAVTVKEVAVEEEQIKSDSITGEEDDFTADLSSEFDNALDFIDAETKSNSSPVVLEGIDAAASSASKTAESVITEKIEVSSEGDVVSHVEAVVESLDKITITEGKKEECTKEKKQLKVGKEMSLRKLKSAYKESLIAAKEGKKLTITSEEGSRVALTELDDNTEY